MDPNVFSTYDRRKGGDVLANQHPLVTVYPWITQRNDIMTLVQPHERGTFFTPGRLQTTSGQGLPQPTSCPGDCDGGLSAKYMGGKDGAS